MIGRAENIVDGMVVTDDVVKARKSSDGGSSGGDAAKVASHTIDGSAEKNGQIV